MFQYWNPTVFVTRHVIFSVMEIEIECDLIYILPIFEYVQGVEVTYPHRTEPNYMQLQ